MSLRMGGATFSRRAVEGIQELIASIRSRHLAIQIKCKVL